MESYRYYNKLLSVLSSCFPAFEINFTIEETNITVSYIKKKERKKNVLHSYTISVQNVDELACNFKLPLIFSKFPT